MSDVLKNFRHTGIVINSVDEMLPFYEDFLGLEVLSRQLEKGEYISHMLGMPGVEVETIKMGLPGAGVVFLELLNFPEKEERVLRKLNSLGFTHMALEVEDVDYIYKYMTEKGLDTVDAPCNTAGDFARVFFGRDPEGNLIEFVQIL